MASKLCSLSLQINTVYIYILSIFLNIAQSLVKLFDRPNINWKASSLSIYVKQKFANYHNWQNAQINGLKCLLWQVLLNPASRYFGFLAKTQACTSSSSQFSGNIGTDIVQKRNEKQFYCTFKRNKEKIILKYPLLQRKDITVIFTT